MTLKQMESYNDNLKRVWKAMDYLDDPGRTQDERDKWMPQFEKLLENQRVLMKECGLESGDKRIIEGFKL